MMTHGIDVTELEIRDWQRMAGSPAFQVLAKILEGILSEAQEAFEDPGCGIEVLKVNQGKVIMVRKIEEMAQKITDFDLEEKNIGGEDEEKEGEIDVDF